MLPWGNFEKDFREELEIIQTKAPQRFSHVREVLRIVDGDYDGHISRHEMQHFFRVFGMAEGTADRFFNRLNDICSGGGNYRTFVKHIGPYLELPGTPAAMRPLSSTPGSRPNSAPPPSFPPQAAAVLPGLARGGSPCRPPPMSPVSRSTPRRRQASPSSAGGSPRHVSLWESKCSDLQEDASSVAPSTPRKPSPRQPLQPVAVAAKPSLGATPSPAKPSPGSAARRRPVGRTGGDQLISVDEARRLYMESQDDDTLPVMVQPPSKPSGRPAASPRRYR